eukprot:Amastigsp_a340017_35.p5 type:complete len:116 gc:universal Amastigsp_a340017_35:937-1284(+)
MKAVVGAVGQRERNPERRRRLRAEDDLARDVVQRERRQALLAERQLDGLDNHHLGASDVHQHDGRGRRAHRADVNESRHRVLGHGTDPVRPDVQQPPGGLEQPRGEQLAELDEVV